MSTPTRISQVDVAEALGIDVSGLRAMEAGGRVIHDCSQEHDTEPDRADPWTRHWPTRCEQPGCARVHCGTAPVMRAHGWEYRRLPGGDEVHQLWTIRCPEHVEQDGLW